MVNPDYKALYVNEELKDNILMEKIRLGFSNVNDTIEYIFYVYEQTTIYIKLKVEELTKAKWEKSDTSIYTCCINEDEANRINDVLADALNTDVLFSGEVRKINENGKYYIIFTPF